LLTKADRLGPILKAEVLPELMQTGRKKKKKKKKKKKVLS
jgi:hypothetical protein